MAAPAILTEEGAKALEAQLESEVRKLCADRGAALPVEAVLEKIRKFGMQPLMHVMEEGLERSRLKGSLITKRVTLSLYTLGMKCCQSQSGSDDNNRKLNQAFIEDLSAYLDMAVVPALNTVRGEALMLEFKRRWEQHKIMTQWLHKIYYYLNRGHGFANKGSVDDIPTTTTTSMRIFKERVFDAKKGDIVDTIQQFVNRERAGDVVDTSLLKSIVELFLVMGICGGARGQSFKDVGHMTKLIRSAEYGTVNETYTDDFESAFLINSRKYYSHKAPVWLDSLDCISYLRKASECLSSEVNRVAAYLNPATEPKLIAILHNELLEKSQRAVLTKDASGLRVILRHVHERREDLGLMFTLYSKIANGHTLPSDMFRDHIKESGMAILERRRIRFEAAKKKDLNDPEFVDELLKLHSIHHDVLLKEFDNNKLYYKGFKVGMEDIINRSVGANSVAEYLAAFLDGVLKGKRGKEKLSDAQVDDYSEKIALLFDFLHDKDIFSECYRDNLSRRLLTKRSHSQDAEEAMISKLKLRMGQSFTSKMEGMLNDLRLSSELSKRYNPTLEKYQSTMGFKSSIEFNVSILTAGFWPTLTQLSTVNLPEEMNTCVRHFTAYYQEEYPRRQIQWVFAEGSVDLAMRFPSRKVRYLFSVSTMQAITLIALSNMEPTTIEDLATRVGTDAATVKKIVHPLIFVKGELLSRTPASEEDKKSSKLEDKDIVQLNADYKSKRMKVSFPSVPLVPTNVTEKVHQERDHVADAALVRIMKTRKALTHQELIAEVLKQILTFRPNVRHIKRRIESLIAREFLAREEDGSYKYLA